VEGFHRPWGLAVDAQGRLLVVDRGRACIRRFSEDLSNFEDFGAGVLHEPTQVACAPGGDVAVVDQNGLVVLWWKAGALLHRRIESVPSPRTVTFDADGALYAGTATGLLFKLLKD